MAVAVVSVPCNQDNTTLIKLNKLYETEPKAIKFCKSYFVTILINIYGLIRNENNKCLISFLNTCLLFLNLIEVPIDQAFLHSFFLLKK
jgi:hypothetical protein